MAFHSPAVVASTRDELCSLLYEAAELEHGLACSYLFAAFSLKRSEADGLTPEQAEAVTRWSKAIKGIAEQEMLHLALVCNLLTALGAAPHLGRPPFPQTSRYYPAGIVIGLHRFDEDTLNRFIFLERPDDIDPEEEVSADPEVDLHHHAPPIAPGALVNGETASESASDDPMTVGQLYEAIDAGICHLVDARGERDVFIGPPPAQATGDYFRFQELVPVTDLASAREALDTLVSQGEGIRGDWQEAHYGRFLAIREELRTFKDADARFDPAWPAADNPCVEESAGRTGSTVVTDPATAPVMRLASGCYTLMTEMLMRFFAHTDESDEQLHLLSRCSVDLMEDVITPLGTLLPRMPVGPAEPGKTAGFGFELHRSVSLMPHRTAAWLIFHERLSELAAFGRELTVDGQDDVVAAVVAALQQAAARIEPALTRRALSNP